MPFDLNELSLAALGAIFAAAALVVWTAGTRLTRYVDGIARKTGLGKAFTGMLLLGGITSLPEVAAVSTSAAVGNAPLAVNNLLGTASVNLILLAAADVIYGRNALTSVAATPATLMQGVLSMLLAAVVAIVAAAGDIPILGVGAGSIALTLGCAGALWLSCNYDNRHVWEVVREEERENGTGQMEGPGHPEPDWPLKSFVIATVISASFILVGGFFLSTSADAIAAQAGIGSGMIGFVLVGLSTSLPEISSITSAIRMREYDMAVGDIFGTNLFNFALIFLADLVYAGEPVLSASGAFEVIGAILAIILTGIFILGLLDRRSRTFFRMGYDSLGALLVFGGGLVVLSGVAGS